MDGRLPVCIAHHVIYNIFNKRINIMYFLIFLIIKNNLIEIMKNYISC